jgi:hypothetical protein
MVGNLFESLLQELGKAMNISDLHADANNSCLIAFENGIEIQVEPYDRDDFLLIVCDLGEVPPGRFREDVFREALKANGLPSPRHGTFAYSEQSNHLILFGMLSFRELNGERIASFLYPFMEKADAWKKTLEHGDVPLANTMTTSRTSGPAGLFGLRP